MAKLITSRPAAAGVAGADRAEALQLELQAGVVSWQNQLNDQLELKIYQLEVTNKAN